MPDSTETATQAPAAPIPALDYVFHPRSVAVVGVTKQRPGFAGIGTTFMLAMKELERENLYAVNPKYDEIEGMRCYPSIRDIEGPVDHVISSVPVRSVEQLVDDCIAKGVRSLHFFTAGFAETGEEGMAEMEAEVVSRAVKAGIRVIGPNCMGLYVPEERLTFTHGTPTEPGPVGGISQSGGNAIDFVMTAAARGIRYSKVVSYGNAADLGECELLDYLADDPQTEIITAYIEGVRDGGRFFEVMKRAAAAKPVIVLKGGRTEAGGRATMSHTASLAGSAAVFDALCRQANAVRVDSVDEMADLAVAFRYMGVPKGKGVAVVGGGGGFSVFAADEIDEAGLECPVLPERTQAQIREFTPAAGTSVASIRSGEPAKLTLAPRALNASATASAGRTCPAVPPAAITHLILLAGCCIVDRDVKEDADGGEAGDEARATVADERERDAGERRDAQDGAEVDGGLAAHEGRQAGREPLPERVSAAQRDPEAGVPEGRVGEDHGGGAEQAELLADDREDHVGRRLGQVVDLLDALAEPDAEDPAGAERDQRLDGLEAGAFRVLPRVDERDEAGAAVRLEPGRGEDERGHHGARGEQHAHRRPRDEQDRADRAEERERGAEVRLEQHE